MPLNVSTLEAQAQQYSQCSLEEFKELFPVPNLAYLQAWLSWTDNAAFNLKLLRSTDDEILREALIANPGQLQQWLSWSNDNVLGTLRLLR
jgi:hypothetical protein